MQIVVSHLSDLTWSRDEASQSSLSKALLLCRMLNAVVEYEVGTGKSPSDAIAAASASFTSAWGKSKEDALRGAKVFFEKHGDGGTKYSGQALTVYHRKRMREKSDVEGEE